MKSSVCKALLLFICVINVYNAQNVFEEKPSQPFVSVPTLETEEKVEKKKSSWNLFKSLFSFSEDDINGQKINYKIKCFYVKDFDLYNIEGLSIDKKYQTALPEKGYLYEPDSNTKLIYNFCSDLKASEQCPYENYQVFIKKKVNETYWSCEPITNGIRNGNTWIIGKNNGERFLKIELNRVPHNKVTFYFKCNGAKAAKEHTITGNSYVQRLIGDTFETFLYIDSAEGCVKADYYSMFHFINTYFYVFGVLLVLFGLFNCILGKRFDRVTIVIITIFSVTYFFVMFSHFWLPPGSENWTIWIVLVIGLIIGCVLGVVEYKFHEKLFPFVLGIFGGFLFGQFLFNFLGNSIPWSEAIFSALYFITCVVLTVLIAFYFKEVIITLFTSFIGSYLFVRGISLFTKYFPNEITIIDLKSRGEEEQLAELMTWRVYIYVLAIFIGTFLSIYAQGKVNKYYKEKLKEAIMEIPEENILAPSVE